MVLGGGGGALRKPTFLMIYKNCPEPHETQEKHNKKNLLVMFSAGQNKTNFMNNFVSI